ncbi:hypothetical protein IPH19_00975 [Candidatus Uhrbacteria bacterium]|nr:MAG: hypothetical protein IPH19_00975 [Candidatus Uhrbacteria bacterium]
MYFGLEVFVAFVLGAFCTAVSLGIVVAYLFKRLLDLTSNEFERQLKNQQRDAQAQRSLASVDDKPKKAASSTATSRKSPRTPMNPVPMEPPEPRSKTLERGFIFHDA